MRIKFFVFLMVSVFVLPTFSAETQQSGSGSLPKPAMEFTSWQVGRSAVGTDPTNSVHTSFITSTQEKCLLPRLWVMTAIRGITSRRLIRLQLHGLLLMPTLRVWHLIPHP